MQIYLKVKKIGKRIQTVGETPFVLESAPTTLRDLIFILVNYCVTDYNDGLRSRRLLMPLAVSQISDMETVGKIGFGIPFGEKEANVQNAVDVAFSAFSDGLYRFFINGEERTALDAPLQLQDGDTVAIIRLTMLAGGLF